MIDKTTKALVLRHYYLAVHGINDIRFFLLEQTRTFLKSPKRASELSPNLTSQIFTDIADIVNFVRLNNKISRRIYYIV